LSTQVLTTRANGPPRQQSDEHRTSHERGLHTSTVRRKTDDRVLSAAVEELRAALCLVGTNQANILGISRLRVAVEDLPTGSGSDVTQSVRRGSILVKW
jgi:hypothetical protein